MGNFSPIPGWLWRVRSSGRNAPNPGFQSRAFLLFKPVPRRSVPEFPVERRVRAVLCGRESAIIYPPSTKGTGLNSLQQVHGIRLASFLNVDNILLCTHNPLFIKNVYGILRDEGFGVETADHPALAVRMVLEQNYSAVMIDAQPFGLSAGDATKIIKTVSPETMVILVGCGDEEQDGLGINMPMDLSELKNLVHNVFNVKISRM